MLFVCEGHMEGCQIEKRLFPSSFGAKNVKRKPTGFLITMFSGSFSTYLFAKIYRLH